MASSKYEVEVNIASANNLKNVNWRHGSLKPYVVVWADPANKLTTRVDDKGDTCPCWDHVLVVPLTSPIEDSYLFVDVVHAGAEEGTKPLVGSARLSLRKVLDEAGLRERVSLKLDLKRPSGRPQGKLEMEVVIRQVRDMYNRAPEAYYAPPPAAQTGYENSYSVSQVTAQPGYRNPYSAPQYAAPAQSGYSYGAPGGYGQAQQGYGEQGYVSYGQAQQGYGEQAYVPDGQGRYGQEEKKSKFGMGTGLAVGAVAGVLGGLAIAEGVDYVEDKITDDAAERVEDDLDDGGYDGDDF